MSEGAARRALIAGLALVTSACVPVTSVTAPASPIDVPLARVLPSGTDLVCVHNPSPGWMFDTLSFAGLKRSLDYSALSRACPKFRGGGLGGIWVESYRTVVISLKN